MKPIRRTVQHRAGAVVLVRDRTADAWSSDDRTRRIGAQLAGDVPGVPAR
jgi:hypothetical protein